MLVVAVVVLVVASWLFSCCSSVASCQLPVVAFTRLGFVRVRVCVLPFRAIPHAGYPPWLGSGLGFSGLWIYKKIRHYNVHKRRRMLMRLLRS